MLIGLSILLQIFLKKIHNLYVVSHNLFDPFRYYRHNQVNYPLDDYFRYSLPWVGAVCSCSIFLLLKCLIVFYYRSGSKWAHVSCALWIPEVSIGCVEKMEPITKISHIPVSISVRPIVRTSRTAFVCASDYDDRTQFHMFEQKNEHG